MKALILFCFIELHVSFTYSLQPNIILIVADDLGWYDVGYHNPKIRTPNLDNLSASGVRLENYYVQPLCTPSRSQLLSGRYQIHTGLQHGLIRHAQPNGLPLTIPTIADKLKSLGYKTHMVGKWHLGYYKKQFLPINRGFDTFFGFVNGCEDHSSHESCDTFYLGGKLITLCGLDFYENGLPSNITNVYSTILFSQRAEQIIKQHDHNEPLFLYIPFQAVHYPEQVPQHYVDKFAYIKDINRRTYFGMVNCMDEAIGNITAALQRNHLFNNSVIVFTTDNGGKTECGGNNWPLRGSKATLWEGGVRGVGFVSSMLLQQKGTINRDLIHISDWFPTLLNLAGGSSEGLKLDGFDVWPSLSLGVKCPRDELLYNIDPLAPLYGQIVPDSPFDNRVMAAIRYGQWKLITGNPGNDSRVPPPEDMSEYYIIHPKTDVCSCGRNKVPNNEKEANLNSFAYDLKKSNLFYYGAWSQTEDTKNKNLWLFDILKDPLEVHDLSNDLPDIVHFLLQKLNQYNLTAVPVLYPPFDLNADPDKHGGYWVPWIT